MKFFYLTIFFIFLFIANDALALSDTLRLTEDKSYNLYNHSQVLSVELPEDINSIKQLKSWQPLKPNYKPAANKALWIRLFIENQKDTPQPIFIRNPDNEISEYFVFEDNKLINKITNGEFISTFGMNENQVVGADSFEIGPKKTIEFYIKVSNFQSLMPFLRLFPQTILHTTYYLKTEKNHSLWLNRYYNHNLNELQIRAFYQGGLGVIFIIILLIFFRNHNEILYKYYLYYVLSAFVFTLIKSRPFTYVGKSVGAIPFVKIYGGEAIMWLGFAAYLVFVAELLDLRKNHQKLYKYISIFSKIFIVYGTILFLWLTLTNDSGLQTKLFILTRIPLIIIYIGILVFTARNVQSPMVKYVLFSNGILILFGLIAWLKAGFLNHQVWPGILNHIFTLPFAILLEIIVFAMAIAHKISANEQIKVDLERKAIELETKALRSQMNPHFIFNSLNSIRYFVLNNENDKAQTYIGKFSKLLRLILNYSRVETISLEEELEINRLYLEVEATRYDDNFLFEISVSPNIDTESCQIPPMLLQPFIENAILHGLRNSAKSKKVLKIKVIKNAKNDIEITIEDNGIGINTAQKQLPIEKHKSLGTEIVNQRIANFNNTHKKVISTKIEQINSPETGTRVTLVLESI